MFNDYDNWLSTEPTHKTLFPSRPADFELGDKVETNDGQFGQIVDAEYTDTVGWRYQVQYTFDDDFDHDWYAENDLTAV